MVPVGLADDGDFGDRGVFDDDALDVERADAIARRSDDVVVAAGEEEMAVGVSRHGVAGHVPVVDEVGDSARQ